MLASGSRYRATLLDRLDIPFSATTPDINETPRRNEAPPDLARRLAVTKAQRVSVKNPNALVIGSDQVVVCDGEVLGKPGTEAKARAQLALLSGQTALFHTGLCLLNAATGHFQATVVQTPVTFRPLTSAAIASYVGRERPLDCAGAFKSEGLGIALFHSIGGDDPNALIGLPLIELCSMLAEEGLSVLSP